MSRTRLLYIEDDPTNAFVLDRLLSPTMDVIIANTVSQAFLKLKEMEFDIILLDINLGNGQEDGVQVKSRIREELNIKTPIVAVTSYAMHYNRESFIDLGFDNYITKPIERDILIEEINKTLNK